MLTVISTALGFVFSVIPSAIKIWKEKQDKNHNIKLLELMMQAQKAGYENVSDDFNKQLKISEQKPVYDHASIPAKSAWIEDLRASVRPIITYAFFLLFSAVKLSALIMVIKAGSGIAEGFGYIWDEESKSLFATVITFWYGHRAILRHTESRK